MQEVLTKVGIQIVFAQYLAKQNIRLTWTSPSQESSNLKGLLLWGTEGDPERVQWDKTFLEWQFSLPDAHYSAIWALSPAPCPKKNRIWEPTTYLIPNVATLECDLQMPKVISISMSFLQFHPTRKHSVATFQSMFCKKTETLRDSEAVFLFFALQA